MSISTLQVRSHTYCILRELAKNHGESMPEALDRIVEEARRTQMFKDANEVYAAIAADPAADASWRAEIAVWDVTVGDGLPVEPDSIVERSWIRGEL